jgi:quercetin dioxygenase-like cupin family protein
MPFVRSSEAITHQIHGVRFVAYANPGTGTSQVCAWRGEIPAGTAGVAHTVSHEEVMHVLSGQLRLRIDGDAADLRPGDVAIVPAGAELKVDNVSGHDATMWVATSVGLQATMADGSVLRPPWANEASTMDS